MSGIRTRHLILPATLLIAFLGSGVLSKLGYTMGGEATSNLTKIHPVSYVLLIVSLFSLLNLKNTNEVFKSLKKNKQAFTVLLILLIAVLYFYLSSNLSSISFIIDTLLCPVLIILNFKHYPESLKRRTRNLGVALITVNATLALTEKLSNHNVFPINVSYGDEFRSTSLLGHPLNNALITSIFIFYTLSTFFPVKKKIAITTSLIISLICFGSRGALYTSTLGIAFLLLIPALIDKGAYFRRIKKIHLGALLIVMAIGMSYLILQTDLGSRLVDVSFYDSSSNVRLETLGLINLDNWSGYLLGKSLGDIERISNYGGVEIIENFFIIWILRFGLIIAVLLAYHYYLFFFYTSPIKSKIYRHIVISLFFLTAATNNSLATNTQALSIFTIMFCLVDQSYNPHRDMVKIKKIKGKQNS